MMQAASAMSETSKALEILRLVPKLKLQPTSYMFHYLISACLKCVCDGDVLRYSCGGVQDE